MNVAIVVSILLMSGVILLGILNKLLSLGVNKTLNFSEEVKMLRPLSDKKISYAAYRIVSKNASSKNTTQRDEDEKDFLDFFGKGISNKKTDVENTLLNVYGVAIDEQ